MHRACRLALVVLFGASACTGSSATAKRGGDASTSHGIRTALDDLERVSGAPRAGVVNFGVPETSLLANNLTGVELLRHGDNRSCGGNGSLDVYSVTGNPEVLWRRMRESGGDLEAAHTTAAGRRVRLLVQSGYDYVTEVALSQASGSGALLAVRTCS